MNNLLPYKSLNFSFVFLMLTVLISFSATAEDLKLKKYVPKNEKLDLTPSKKVEPGHLDNPIPLSERKKLGAKKAMEYIRRKEEARSLTEDDDL